MHQMEIKAYSYIRFSSPEQSKGGSYQRQRESCEAYCRQHSLTLVDDEEYTFFDRGVSAFSGANTGPGGQLARFLSLVKDGSITPGSYLIVESLDRLSREHSLEAVPRFIELLNSDIVIVTLTDKRVYSKAGGIDFMGIMYSIMVMSRAHEESTSKSHRLGIAWGKKKEAARDSLKPLGDNAPLWITYDRDSVVYALHPERVKVVRRIFQMYVDGYGKVAIAKALNAEGVPAFKGGTWGTTSLARLLSNRAVLGEYQPRLGSGAIRINAGNAIPGFFPPAIDESLFHRAQEANSSRHIAKATRQSKNFNLWQGIAKCAKCQAAMHIVNKGTPPQGYVYLACYQSRKGVCDAKMVRLDKSEIVFREILAKVGNLSLVQASASSLDQQLRAVIGQLTAEQVNLEDYQAALGSRYSLTLDNLSHASEQKIAVLQNEKATLEAALAADTIIDKEAFFAKLDLMSYEGRAQANGLLKRLKIKVAIGRNSVTTDYILLKEGEGVLGIIYYPSGKIESLAFTTDLLDKVKAQDFDGSIESSLDMLLTERMSDRMLNGEWWSDFTLEGKISEMLKRVGVDFATDSAEFQFCKDRLDLDRTLSNPKIQEWAVNAQSWIDSLDATGKDGSAVTDS